MIHRWFISHDPFPKPWRVTENDNLWSLRGQQNFTKYQKRSFKNHAGFLPWKSCYSCCVVFFGWTLKLLTCLTLTACTIPRWPTKEHPTTLLGQDKTVENSHARSVSGWRRQKPLLFGVATMPMRLTLWWNKKHPVMKNPWQILGWWVLMTFEGCFFLSPPIRG